MEDAIIQAKKRGIYSAHRRNKDTNGTCLPGAINKNTPLATEAHGKTRK